MALTEDGTVNSFAMESPGVSVRLLISFPTKSPSSPPGGIASVLSMPAERQHGNDGASGGQKSVYVVSSSGEPGEAMDDDIDCLPAELDKQVRSPPCVSQRHGHPRNPQPILSASAEWDDMAAAGRDGEYQRDPAGERRKTTCREQR
jgi:hypothetical protein